MNDVGFFVVVVVMFYNSFCFFLLHSLTSGAIGINGANTFKRPATFKGLCCSLWTLIVILLPAIVDPSSVHDVSDMTSMVSCFADNDTSGRSWRPQSSSKPSLIHSKSWPPGLMGTHTEVSLPTLSEESECGTMDPIYEFGHF